jgi:hypothetical protein
MIRIHQYRYNSKQSLFKNVNAILRTQDLLVREDIKSSPFRFTQIHCGSEA